MLFRIGKPAGAVTQSTSCSSVTSASDRASRWLAGSRRSARPIKTRSPRRPPACTVTSPRRPLHGKDEEEPILPRLGGKDPRVDVELEAVAQEHAEHERPPGALAEVCELLARDPSRHAESRSGDRNGNGGLEQHLGVHLQRGEKVIALVLRKELQDRARSPISRQG